LREMCGRLQRSAPGTRPVPETFNTIFKMTKATPILGIAALVMGVCLPMARVSDSRQHQLRHAFDLIITQPRLHRDLIKTFGPQLTPLLVQELRAWRGANSFYSDLYVSVYRKLPASLQQFFPEPMSDEQRCLNVIRALAYSGRAAASGTHTLIPFLSDPRFAPDAAHALASIGPDAQEAVPALIEALDDQVPYAATALGNIGAGAAAAIPALNQAQSNAVFEGPGWFRREVEKALGRIHSSLVPDNHDSFLSRQAAGQALSSSNSMRASATSCRRSLGS
jgi:hypothetical protein